MDSNCQPEDALKGGQMPKIGHQKFWLIRGLGAAFGYFQN
jgi:hypothetical protein